MVHTVQVDKKVESALKELLTSKQVQIGLLIGQATKLKDYVLLSVRTPSLQELKDNEASDEVPSTGQIEDWWVLEHAKQVVSLLPGGLEVVGVFCLCPKEMLASLYPRLAKIISDLSSMNSSERHHTKYVLLHWCATTLRSKGQVTDLGDRQGGFRPAEVKFQTSPLQLIRVESALRLAWDWYECFHGNSTQDLLKSVQATVKEFVKDMFSQTLFKVNGRFIQDEGEPLVIKSKKAEQQSLEDGVKVDLFTKQALHSASDVQVLSQGRRVVVTGSLPLLAFLHPKATCREALEAIKEDAVRSLTSQLVALTEADCILETANGLSSSLPYRVSVTIPSVPWTLSECSLPGEDVKECEGRVRDLLGVSTAEATYTFPGHQPTPSLTSDPELDKREGRGQVWTLVAAVVVLVIAMVTWIVLYLR